MTSPYAWGLMIQLTAWFIIVNALAYAVHPYYYISENSSIPSWTSLMPFIAIAVGIYLIRLGGTIKNKETVSAADDD